MSNLKNKRTEYRGLKADLERLAVTRSDAKTAVITAELEERVIRSRMDRLKDEMWEQFLTFKEEPDV